MLSAIALAATARRLEDGTCPCLATTQVHEPAGADISFTLVGETYTYPSDYGLTCAAHDSATQPYCARSAPPSWCADAWCYVDRTNCNLPFSNSVFFSSLAYSYFTCGASNTFDAWFGDSGSGGGGGVHALTDLVTLMKTYTQTISDTLEENFIEAQSVRLPHLHPHPPPYPLPPAAAGRHHRRCPAHTPLTDAAHYDAATGVGMLSRKLMSLH
tara:strand:- start:49 stop:690 length:642 start_codon:yes stop_codon:yes gene_type:complete